MPRIINRRVAPAAPVNLTRPHERAAWRRGYQENLKGRDRDTCPHLRDLPRGLWLDGWDAAERSRATEETE